MPASRLAARLLLLAAAACCCCPLLAAAAGGDASPDDAVFVPGALPLDSDGAPIHAHAGGMLRIAPDASDSTWLWFGQDAPASASAVVLYTSHDLAKWRRRGTVLAASSIPQQQANGSALTIERPRVLYNSARRTWVLLFGLRPASNASAPADVGWATAPSQFGPFAFQGSGRPDGLATADLNVAAEADGSAAYLVRTSPGQSQVTVSRLSSDFLSSDGVCTSVPGLVPSASAAGRRSLQRRLSWRPQQQHPQRQRRQQQQRQLRAGRQQPGAPVLFPWQGRWYLLASQRGGGKFARLPSAPRLFVSNGSQLCGAAWQELPRPARGPGAATAFDSSPAFVLPHRFASGRTALVYFGDRWNAAGPGGLSNASYVPLPVVASPAASGLALELANPPGGSWRLSDLDSAAGAREQQQRGLGGAVAVV